MGILGNETVPDLHGFPVHGEGFEIAMGRQQDGAPGSFVDAAGLHAHEPVFHDIDPADPVLTPEGVEHAHDTVG